MHLKKATTIVAVLVISISNAKEVCYGKYGCFSNASPFDNPLVPLPQPPTVIGLTYKLFTNTHSTTAQILDDSDATKLNASSYDGAKTTAIIIHGFNEHAGVPWINILKDALLKLDDHDFNTIIVDWKNGAKLPYEQAASNTRMVGAQVAELIKFLVNSTEARPESFYLVGFGLGAHASGFVGKRIEQSKIALGRITGLDPTGKYFKGDNPDVRLDASDADFVDVIHTDSEENGLAQALGDIDFYPNGGEDQKGCGFLNGDFLPNDSCDHKRAIEYFIESIRAKCPMRAFPCKNMAYFERGWCISSNDVFPSMGFKAYESKGLSFGKHFLLTNSLSPFCVYHYTVFFKTGTGHFAPFKGRITVRIRGEKGVTGYIRFKKRTFPSASFHSFVAPSVKDLGTLNKLEVRHDGIPWITQWKLDWAVVKPAWGGNSNYYSACFNAYLNSGGGVKPLRRGRPTEVC